MVAQLELPRCFLAFAVTARIGAAARRNLRNAERAAFAPHGCRFARRQDQAGVGNGQTQDGDQLFEVFVTDRGGWGE